MSGKVFVGTSGFAYKEWKGPFYPESISDKEMLFHYSRMLPSVEINYTFRRLPSDKTLESWKTQASEDFRITLKASQRITHWKRLVDTQDDVDEFVRRARTLEDRLGVILFQMPPHLAFDAEVVSKFLEGLPMPFRYAMEFRHSSFNSEEARSLLTQHDVAFCGAETDESGLDEVPLTAQHAYLRLRKEEYSTDEIDGWAKRVNEVCDAGHDVYCYFKHEGGGLGPAYAVALKEQTE